MSLRRDIHPLADFKRMTPDFVRRMKETGEPITLTIDGKAELVVQDAESVTVQSCFGMGFGYDKCGGVGNLGGSRISF